MSGSNDSGNIWDDKALGEEHQGEAASCDWPTPLSDRRLLTTVPSDLSDGVSAAGVALAAVPIVNRVHASSILSKAKRDAAGIGHSTLERNIDRSATSMLVDESNEFHAPEATPVLPTVQSSGVNSTSDGTVRIVPAETAPVLQQRGLLISAPSRSPTAHAKKQVRQDGNLPSHSEKDTEIGKPSMASGSPLRRTQNNDLISNLSLNALTRQMPAISGFIAETPASIDAHPLRLATPHHSSMTSPAYQKLSNHRFQETDSTFSPHPIAAVHARPSPTAGPGSSSAGDGREVDQNNANTSVPNSMQPALTQQPASLMNNGLQLTASPNETSTHILREHNEIVERSPGARYLRFSEKLGSGAYKVVYRAYDTIEGIEVAWNVVNLSGVPRNERSRIVNEVRLLERLHHSNIISFHGSWVNRELEQVIFVTEILSSGTLKMFINKVQVIRWKIAKRWAIQILKGLEYLHSQDPPIIHRDLKCDNIFINGTSGDLRIGDLGLSTVISNKNRALSVLGTPEFMAPELYDEAYDEKVDIYAFGMCLLEIFTKETPYRECSNPAQIYKKVIHGVPPQCLTRIRNLDARNFITLCLGIDNGTKKHRRPSASQLLQHTFLAKQVDDDSEVEVDPAMSECAVLEMQAPTGKSATTSASYGGSFERDKVAGDGLFPLVNSLGSPSKTTMSAPVSGEQGDNTKNDPSSDRIPAYAQQYYSIPTDQGVGVIVAQLQVTTHDYHQHTGHDDGFGGMPETEKNIKKVKVLMGRGQEIENDDDFDLPMSAPISLTTSGQWATTPVNGETNLRSESNDSLNCETQTNQRSGIMSTESLSTKPPEKQYLVFAAVMEENDNANPYFDDIMKLIITLPVEGQTQNVQFDFHLVEDDAIQVAREMVTELHIPEDAVLEISETISGLARSARIRQGNYKARQQQSISQQHVIHPPDLFVPHHSATGDSAMKRHIILGPNGNNIQAYAANFENDMLHNTNVSALVYQGYGGAVMPTHFTSIGDMPDALPQAAAAAVQSHLHSQHLLEEQSLTTSSKVPESSSILPTQSSEVLIQGPGAADLELELSLVNPSSQITSQQGTLARQSLNAFAPESLAVVATQSAISKSVEPITGQLIEENTEEDNGFLSDASESSNSSELCRLKEDYKKNLSRAQKAFLMRMDNMHRSKEEKEAQHLKTLEKHEKERAEFERRLKLAEEEQDRRLKLLEKEWATKLENAKRSAKQTGAKRDIIPTPSSEDDARLATNSHQRITLGDRDNTVNPTAVVLETLGVDEMRRTGKATSTLPSCNGSSGDLLR